MFKRELRFLTPSEKRIMKYISEGLTSREIADLLHNSVKTIRNHTGSIRQKLHLTGAGFHALRKVSIENRHLFNGDNLLGNKKYLSRVEEERKRIAQELHDSLGQEMILIKNSIERVKKGLSKNKRDACDLISNAATKSLHEIRRIIDDLRPAELQFGLKKAIRKLTGEISMCSGIVIRERIDLKEAILPPEIENHIFRIIQESLSNITQHSVANKAFVEISCSQEFLFLRITDNGRGFDRINLGSGIKGIQERAQKLGGSFKIASEIGRGTTLEVTIPSPTKNP